MTYPARVSRQTMDSPASPAAEPQHFRPKVLRRPASLQEVPLAAPEPTPPTRALTIARIEPTPPPAITAPAARPWQEDARFGFAMVLIVLLVNLLLVFGLRHSGGPDVSISLQTTPSDTAAAAPVPEVTTYARPVEPRRQPRAVNLLGADDLPLDQ